MIFSLPHWINWCSIPYKPTTVQFLSVLTPPRLPRTCSCLTNQLLPSSPSYAATAPSSTAASTSRRPAPPPLHLSHTATTVTPPHSVCHRLYILSSLSTTSPLPCATVLQLVSHSPPRAKSLAHRLIPKKDCSICRSICRLVSSLDPTHHRS
jgi:hypothetical protein